MNEARCSVSRRAQALGVRTRELDALASSDVSSTASCRRRYDGARSSGMAGGNRQLLLVGFTLVGGALGFYVEEKVEAYYKEERFKRFEAAVQARADSNVNKAEAKK